MNNNKGFNWFFPIMIGAILLFFFSNMNSNSESNTINEAEFYKLMQQGKVQEVVVYKDTEKADVFLTKAAKAEVAAKKPAKERSAFDSFNFAPKADYNLGYGDLKLFLEKFDKIKQENPAIPTTTDYALGKNPMTELLFTVLFLKVEVANEGRFFDFFFLNRQIFFLVKFNFKK